MISIARRLLAGLSGADVQVEGRGVDAAVVVRSSAQRALERVRRGIGPAPFTGDERVLLHAAALPVLRAAGQDPGPGVSPDRVDEMVQAVSDVLTPTFRRRVQARLSRLGSRGGAQARDLAAAASADLLTVAVRAATSTPRARTEDDDERDLLDAVFASAHPSPDLLDALVGCYLARGDHEAAENARAARERIAGR